MRIFARKIPGHGKLLLGLEMNTPALLVFTDLDGTLLDHVTYEWRPALAALKRLDRQQIPVILSTSKTAAEVAVLRHDIGSHHPAILENGATLLLPESFCHNWPDAKPHPEGCLVSLSLKRQEILDILQGLRDEHGYDFRGFADMTDDELAGDCGLSVPDASRARMRDSTEPLIWRDTAARRAKFCEALQEHGLRMLKGGRYWHVMGDCDKAKAMQKLVDCYSSDEAEGPHVIALGDSPNDLEMLKAADTAVVIRSKQGRHMRCKSDKRVLYSRESGPEGWNSCMMQILDDLVVTG